MGFYRDVSKFTVKVENVKEFEEAMNLVSGYVNVEFNGVDKVEYFPYGEGVEVVGKDTDAGFKVRAIIDGQKYVFASHADMLRTVYKAVGYGKLESEFARFTTIKGHREAINYVYTHGSIMYDYLKDHHTHSTADDNENVIVFTNLDADGKTKRCVDLCSRYDIEFMVCNRDWGEFNEG